jgi:hypothetical protein
MCEGKTVPDSSQVARRSHQRKALTDTAHLLGSLTIGMSDVVIRDNCLYAMEPCGCPAGRETLVRLPIPSEAAMVK